jgi:antitoxin ParD1/3/4
MDVSGLALPPDLAEFVRSKMTSGKYASEYEVVREALVLLRERDQVRAQRIEQLRREIQMGVDQFDRGESKSFDVQEIKEVVRKRLGANHMNR